MDRASLEFNLSVQTKNSSHCHLDIIQKEWKKKGIKRINLKPWTQCEMGSNSDQGLGIFSYRGFRVQGSGPRRRSPCPLCHNSGFSVQEIHPPTLQSTTKQEKEKKEKKNKKKEEEKKEAVICPYQLHCSCHPCHRPSYHRPSRHLLSFHLPSSRSCPYRLHPHPLVVVLHVHQMWNACRSAKKWGRSHGNACRLLHPELQLATQPAAYSVVHAE